VVTDTVVTDTVVTDTADIRYKIRESLIARKIEL